MITVVCIKSISYTGTTWLNCLLGCHENAFALGSPERILNLDDWNEACLVHSNCPFWPEFQKVYDPAGNFFLQLAEFSGKDFIIINNPRSDLIHKQITIKQIYIVRDGRAVCTSYVRHKDSDFQSAVRWFTPPASAVKFDDKDVLYLRYEEVIRDQSSAIKKIGDFIGLEYPENFYKFWEFDHHLISGNASIYGMIKRFQGIPFELQPERNAFYENEYQRLKGNVKEPVFDERWKELSREDLYFFDRSCGEINESWGYPRHVFTDEEKFRSKKCQL